MKEENKGTPQNKWSRIYRKRWFFPAVYLVVAALLLTAVIWFQNVGNQMPEAGKEGDSYTPNLHDKDAQSVMDPQEMIEMPVKDDNEATIVTKFFDYDASEEDRANALVHYNKRYYQSTGIDIASEDGEEFDVIASLSGTVSEVKEDPLLGNVVVLDHDNEVHTYYASLGEVSVKEGDEVKQGDALGTAGKNLFGKDNGVHVHFELRKDGKEVNPELFFNQPVSKLASLETEEVIENDSDDETEANVDADEEGLEEDTDEDDEEKLDDNEDKVDEEDKTDDEEDADETNEEDTE